MKSAGLVQAGRLEEGLSALQQEIRDKPEDTRLRIFLFQLNCIFGRLDKALAQLQVIASLSADTMLLAQIFRPVIACEMLRREAFAGQSFVDAQEINRAAADATRRLNARAKPWVWGRPARTPRKRRRAFVYRL